MIQAKGLGNGKFGRAITDQVFLSQMKKPPLFRGNKKNKAPQIFTKCIISLCIGIQSVLRFSVVEEPPISADIMACWVVTSR